MSGLVRTGVVLVWARGGAAEMQKIALSVLKLNQRGKTAENKNGMNRMMKNRDLSLGRKGKFEGEDLV